MDDARIDHAGSLTVATTHTQARYALPRVIKRTGELWLGTCADGASAADLIGLGVVLDVGKG